MGYKVLTIGGFAFYQCYGLTNVVLGNNLTSIGDHAFDFCTTLTGINIPNHVTSLGQYTFQNCYQLASLTIGTGVTTIGTYDFFNCTSLTNITIPKNITRIDGWAFCNCASLTSVYFLGNAPSIGSLAFSGDNAIVYHTSGTTGWDSTFGGLSTWNPQPQASDGSFGVQTNHFGFNITGNNNLIIVVEACTNLFNPVWQPVQTNTLTGGSAYFNDPQWTNYPGRFYRLRSP